MKRALFIFVIALVGIPFVSAKETFYCSLDSQEVVEDQDGTVTGGKFEKAKFGEGFYSEKVGDIITFPVEDRFTNLEAGTVEFWVKMGVDAAKVIEERCWFLTYLTPNDAIYIDLDGKYAPQKARMRIKSAGTWYNADSPSLDWQKGEIHHVAGTWGEDGVKLYLDGEEAAVVSTLKGGPTLMSDVFGVNNASDGLGFHTNCAVDEFWMSDHQKKPEEFRISDPNAVKPAGKVAAAWGSVKDMY